MSTHRAHFCREIRKMLTLTQKTKWCYFSYLSWKIGSYTSSRLSHQFFVFFLSCLCLLMVSWCSPSKNKIQPLIMWSRQVDLGWKLTSYYKYCNRLFIQINQEKIIDTPLMWSHSLGKLGKFSRLQTEIYFSYFSQKKGFAISCKLSLLEMICTKCQILFSGKNNMPCDLYCFVMSFVCLFGGLTALSTAKVMSGWSITFTVPGRISSKGDFPHSPARNWQQVVGQQPTNN